MSGFGARAACDAVSLSGRPGLHTPRCRHRSGPGRRRPDGVSAPAVDQPGLRQVVEQAHQDGLDLKIVVIDRNPPIDTPLRDIATEVGQANPGSTVLVLSPSFAGTYSPNYDRVTLEAGEDLAKTGNPVQSSQNFVSQLNTPDFPWTGLTIAVLFAVFLAAFVTRILQVKGRRVVADENAATSDS